MTQRFHAAHMMCMLLIAAGVAIATPVFAQSDRDAEMNDLRSRVNHLERELQDVQAETFRNRHNGGGNTDEAAGPPPPGQAPLAQRVSDIEATLQRLTGQLEELQHRMNDLSAKLDHMQNDMNYHFGNPQDAARAGTDNDQDTPDNNAQNAARQLAPGPSNLGTVPEHAIENVPQPRPSPTFVKPSQSGAAPTDTRIALKRPPSGGDGSAAYNAAMDLLARGAYDQAREAFHSVADQYPGSPSAQEALYWAGDISYSAKKDYAEAARSFAELLKKYPKAPHAPDGMLKLGESLLGLSQKQEGCATLAAFPAKYPSASKALVAKAKADRRKASCK